ncbi:uncharacterized protein LOC108462628 [Gossypium arboreum]|uniref:uncharacterized protein LOC108462628 n=1 Tax=Gossypium arboreum TaxID=29729 RepID=UPI0008197545|nr:uncharacterized protein LOC108462628 [Gossypium arboreum]
MLNLNKILKDDPPTVKEGEEDEVTAFTTVEAWKHFDFLCRNYILNGLSDALYKVYSVKKITKGLWTSLDHKYKAEDVGAKNFLVAKFLNFVMIDSKLVVNQVHELQLIIHVILAEGMMISESFQVEAIIEKLPLAWNDFKNYLKYKRKEMSVEDLIVRLRIQEDNRGTKKRLSKAANSNSARANIVEVNKDFKEGKQPENGSKLGPKGGISKKQKFQGKCFNCNKMGYKSSSCRIPKKVRANKANTVEEIFKEVSDMGLYA